MVMIPEKLSNQLHSCQPNEINNVFVCRTSNMASGHTNPLNDFVERFLDCAATGDATKLAVFLKGYISSQINSM